MPGLKTNERPGTRAVLRHSRMSAYKAREVLDLIRGQDYVRATEILEYSERGAAEVIGKLLHSAAANAAHNEGMDPTEMFVSACYADEGSTLKRWRPRARGRATRIRKRTCHVTVILARLPEDELARRRAKEAAEQSERRARRVAGGRRRERVEASTRSRRGRGGAAEQAETELQARDNEALEALAEARALAGDVQHSGLASDAEEAIDFAHEPEEQDAEEAIDVAHEPDEEAAEDAVDVAPEPEETDAQDAVEAEQDAVDDSAGDHSPEAGPENDEESV